MQVFGETGEPGAVDGDFASLDSVPESVGTGARDTVVYPAWGDVEGEFVVEDCLEGGDYLSGVSESWKRIEGDISSRRLLRTL